MSISPMEEPCVIGGDEEVFCSWLTLSAARLSGERMRWFGGQDSSYANWERGSDDPSDLVPVETCVALHTSTGKWEKISCVDEVENGVICETSQSESYCDMLVWVMLVWVTVVWVMLVWVMLVWVMVVWVMVVWVMVVWVMLVWVMLVWVMLI